MSWMRTAGSLITFGFALYKFFEYLQEQGRGAAAGPRILGARTYAVVMIATGIITLAFSTWQYRERIKSLSAFYPKVSFSRSLLLVASLVSVLGILAFVAALLRL